MNAAVLRVAVVSFSVLAIAGRAGADCVIQNTASVVEYWSSKSPEQGDLRCDWKESGPRCHLSGWLIVPKKVDTDASAGRFPAIVYLHGSVGTKPEDPTFSRSGICEIANFFVDEGYVFFAPVMRGYDDGSPAGKGAGFHNTGTDYNAWAEKKKGDDGKDKVYWILHYMANMEMKDIQAALSTLAEQKSRDGSKALVDKSRIAIMGHSFGGARTVLASAADLKPEPKAAIDLSGAAMSWNTPDGGSWGLWMKRAASKRKMPMYIQMTPQENPEGLVAAATEVFAAANSQDGNFGGAVMTLISNFAIPLAAKMECDVKELPPYWCAHGYLVKAPEQTARWLPGVKGFLKYYGF
jgi:dienelactone hydrolase